MTEPTQAELNQIMDWTSEAEETGSMYPGMTYEQGVRAMCDVLQGEMTVEELIDG